MTMSMTAYQLCRPKQFERDESTTLFFRRYRLQRRMSYLDTGCSEATFSSPGEESKRQVTLVAFATRSKASFAVRVQYGSA